MKLKELPVYKSMKEFRLYIFSLLPNFKKDIKHTIGQKLLDCCCRCVCDLAAISRNKKSPGYQLECIRAFLTEIDVIEDLIDFLVESKSISYQQAAHIVLMLEDIGNQSGGMEKVYKEAYKETSRNPRG